MEEHKDTVASVEGVTAPQAMLGQSSRVADRQPVTGDDVRQEFFVRGRLIEDIAITVVDVEECVYPVPHYGKGWKMEKTGTKKFLYDNDEIRYLNKGDSVQWNQKRGDRLRKRTWNMIYVPTGQLAVIQEVEYLTV